MPNRVQTLRSSTALGRPAAGSRAPGELYVNFPDNQLGVINAAQNAQDLIAVRFFSTTTSYVAGDHVLQGGNLYRAKAAVAAGAFNATQWDQVATASQLTTATAPYLLLAGGTLTGPVIAAADPTQPLGLATKQYVDATNIRYKNRVINGDMSCDQRQGGALVPVTGVLGIYIIDRWSYAGQAIGNVGQIALNSANMTGQFTYAFGWTTTTAHTVVAADYSQLAQAIEGYNFADVNWGSANAQPVTLEFMARSSLTGTFAGCLQNVAVTRSYVFTYSIPTANVWTKIKLNIPGDIAGTWSVAANAAAVYLIFNLGVGSTRSTTAGAWVAGNFISAPGAVNPVATLNATFQVTGVALMVGSAAANAEPEFKSFADNLRDCQRYYQFYSQLMVSGYGAAAGNIWSETSFSPQMRAAPTVAIANPSYGNASAITLNAAFANHLELNAKITATGAGWGTVDIKLDADF